ncbi:MAG TPA: tetratricopeptide repeat protein [Thermoanaerobaculia bacterium]|nr:tetratricopeptide repeat protein [Thermoanaerobaculia bacterium]
MRAPRLGRSYVLAAGCLALALLGCRSAGRTEQAVQPGKAPEAFSLRGEPLLAPELPPEVRAEREGRLAEARARLAAAPGDADAAIWVGRCLGYLGRYREAVAVFTRGAERHPGDARFFRHRGHRFLTLRHLDLAEADLARAAELVRGRPDEVEPDGLPNERGIPTSTLQSNVWYHLGLARYLQGDFEGALDAYRECLAVSKNPDMLVATSHWLYATLRRLGRSDEAARVLEPIHAGLDVIENRAYHRLLLLYRGEASPDELLAEAGEAGSLDFATVAYGVAAWHLYNGREAEARALFERIVAGGEWPAFGHLAAEAELARWPSAP